MEPVFENRYKRTADVEKEMYRYQLLSSPQAIICLVIVGVVMVAEIVAMFLARDMLAFCLAVAIIAALYIFLTFFRCSRMVKLSQKRIEELYNGAYPEVSAVLDGAELIYSSEERNSKTNVDYARIKSVFETPHYYMLRTDSKLVYAFQKGAFTKGNEAEFVPYVKKIIADNKNGVKQA